MPRSSVGGSEDAVLAQHSAMITRACRRTLPRLKAVILHGGYGRGEGAWYRDSVGDVHPYNDYDVLVVLGWPVRRVTLRDLGVRLAEETGVRWVDVSQTSILRLGLRRPSILNYDLKHASRVLYGDPDTTRRIPPMAADALPLSEIKTLFLTRLWTLLGSLDHRGLGRELHGDDARFFRSQMAKAVLASVDVLLILSGKYDASYEKRVRVVGRTAPAYADRQPLFEWALQEKMTPDGSALPPAAVQSRYDACHALFFEVMATGLERYYDRRLGSVGDIAEAYRGELAERARTVAAAMLGQGVRRARRRLINLAQIYVAGSYHPGGIAEPILEQGCRLLARIDRRLHGQAMSWDQARVAAAELRLNG